MPALHVRNVPEPLYEKLRVRAEREGRSINGEAIAILEEALSRPSPSEARVAMTRVLRRPRSIGSFKRFTDAARKTVVRAQNEARELRHGEIETAHLLLGLFSDERGLAAEILASLGLSREEVRRRVVEESGIGDAGPTGRIPFAPEAKRVLELAMRESLALGHNYIGTEHILLGLLQEEGAGARILRQLGAEVGTVREAVARALGKATYETEIDFSYVRAGGSWKYRVEDLAEPLEESLRRLPKTAPGWELVSVTGEPPALRAILKRCA